VPDRLPSLIVLVAFWIPPAIAGWVAAGALLRNAKRDRPTTYVTLMLFVVGYAAAWFLYNLGRMPPYIPDAQIDPTIATPKATLGLAVFTSALVLPGSAVACFLAFRRRMNLRRQPSAQMLHEEL
jgi:Na+-driven multidrug efflux pump